MEEKRTAEELLEDLLHGDAGDDALRLLADRIQDDNQLGGRVRDELEFSEMLRQTLKSEAVITAESVDALVESASLETNELIDRVCDGKPTAFECDRLAKHLRENPEAIGQLKQRLATDEWTSQAMSEARCEEAFVEALETRMWAETRRDSFVTDFAARLDQEIAIQDRDDNLVLFPWGVTIAKMAAVAAVVAFGAFMLAEQVSQKIGNEPVASLVKASDDVRWKGNLAPGANGGVLPGRYELSTGVIALKFSSGGELTVEGPAAFSVDDDGSAFVYYGVALARANMPGNAINLKARGINVLEQAPLIGIDARSEFFTNAFVLSGDGGICMNDGATCRSLFEYEAVKADYTRDKLVDIPYNPRAFSKTWELLSGVETNLGDVRIELPGAEPTRVPREGEVRVFVENESFRPSGELEADLFPSGQFATVDSNSGKAIETEGELRSYLLQVGPSDDRSVEASLTFEHQVVGVIFSSDRLESSDLSVGSSMQDPGGDFSRVRGLDYGSDELLLSDDGRTLNLRLQSGGQQLDQVRVLVAVR